MRIEYFQLIDGIERYDEAPPLLVARARVPETATIFEGHFPGYPLMPGVLLIECMAQASGFLLLAGNRFERMPFLVGVKDAKLRNFVPPSSELVIEAEIEHDGSGFAVTRARISNDGAGICDARLTLRFLPFPSPELAGHLKERARSIGLSEAYLS